jgi:hypothetical protein
LSSLLSAALSTCLGVGRLVLLPFAKKRAIERGYVVPTRSFKQFVEVHVAAASAVKRMAKSAALHIQHDEVTNSAHHFARAASFAARDCMTQNELQTSTRIRRDANRAKHNVSRSLIALGGASPHCKRTCLADANEEGPVVENWEGLVLPCAYVEKIEVGIDNVASTPSSPQPCAEHCVVFGSAADGLLSGGSLVSVWLRSRRLVLRCCSFEVVAFWSSRSA